MFTTLIVEKGQKHTVNRITATFLYQQFIYLIFSGPNIYGTIQTLSTEA